MGEKGKEMKLRGKKRKKRQINGVFLAISWLKNNVTRREIFNIQ